MFYKKYLGKREKRGLYSSSTKKLINADLVGAINIMKKWDKSVGIERDQITGLKLFNPKVLKIKP